MYYPSLTNSVPVSSFTRYSDRYKDVLDRALRDRNPNLSTNTLLQPSITEKPPLKFCFVQIKSLGIGAYSSVYLVTEERTRALYAMKIITRSALMNHKDNLFQEIKIHLQLRHPNIASLYHIYNDEGSLRLILEYSECNLMSVLKQKGRFSQKEASNIVSQILEGIQYIHSKGVTHRDIKLQNILLSNNDIAKICDFGLARRSKEFDSSDLVGTIDYLSPEIVKEKRYNHKTDIWAVGVMLWEMIKGQSSFLGSNGSDSEKYSKLIEMNTEDINYTGCSPELQRFFKRIFTKEYLRAEASELLKEDFILKHSLKDETLNYSI